MIKFIVIIAFLMIIFSLGSALIALVKNKDNPEQSQKAFKALALRIGLSVVLFIFVAISLAMGWFQPKGIGARMAILQAQQQKAP